MSHDQHTRHCCRIHGCKWGEKDSCPVWLGYKTQETAPNCCQFDYDLYDDTIQIVTTKDIPKVNVKVFQARRIPLKPEPEPTFNNNNLNDFFSTYKGIL